MGPQDQRDYEALFRASFGSVTRTVFLVVHDRAVAEEITQDAFLKLFERWGTVGQYERPEAWARKVALRMAVKWVRRERLRPWREARGAVVPWAREVGDGGLFAAVQSLPAQQRACVVLHYWEDQPVIQIANTLGVSVSTVKQHLFRARARLAATVGEELSDDVR